ncbi:hypothetical protein Pla163_12110 [Planctomycetes bacterium Pla163]|uniref:Uncharacterized protein n=1 Tax=Rohdeia mirabilis TaxID=2528008 RepID=A0A518CY26_9BACT|nr:hypothetical protein Pla163_12110 [Planctomycetes bacterium Pla163]
MRTRLLAAVLSVAPLLSAVLVTSGCDAGSGPLAVAWPPTVGAVYPDLDLRGLDGERVQLSSLTGRVLLIEPIGMT